MDIEKQPGIQVLTVALNKCYYKRLPIVDEKTNDSIDFNLEINLNEDKSQSIVLLKCFLKRESLEENKETQVEIEIEYVGVFAVQENAENMDLEKFSNTNAPAILFPYIRQMIHELTLKGSLPLVILPPLNILALFKDKKSQ